MMVLLLRLLEMVDTFWLFLAEKRRRRREGGASAAGAGVQSPASVSIIQIGEVSWPDFPTLAHSFWRAQELTLFRRHRDLFAAPSLDLGCGDRIFAELAGFPRDGLGVDLDWASLVAAIRSRPAPMTMADAGRLPVADRRFASCLSNSVLEHLPDLDRCISEVARTLKPGGRFIFSVTLGTFTSQLRRLTGARDTRRWLRAFGHYQEPSEAELSEKLRRCGFSVEECRTYQPVRTTALYRFLLSPVFQFIERKTRKWIARPLRQWLARCVVASLNCGADGACCFVVAQKRAPA